MGQYSDDKDGDGILARIKDGEVSPVTLGIIAGGLAASGMLAFSAALKRRTREIRECIEVEATAEAAFNLWSRFEIFPRFMKDVVRVTRTGEKRLHWIAASPLGRAIEWDAEITAYRPDRFVAWRSVTPSVESRGEVHLEPTERGVLVMLVMRYVEPDGPIGWLLSRFAGRGPKNLGITTLQRFKELIEENSPGTLSRA